MQDDNPLEKQTPAIANEIITELSDEAKLKQEVIQSLLEPCDTFGKLR